MKTYPVQNAFVVSSVKLVEYVLEGFGTNRNLQIGVSWAYQINPVLFHVSRLLRCTHDMDMYICKQMYLYL